MLQIYIVDDAAEDLVLTERLLRQCKIVNPISCFSSGDEMIAAIGTPGGTPANPGLVFLDMIMAPCSGLDVLKHWSRSPWSKRSLTVMVSGLSDIKVLNQGYQYGAKTFLLKPLTRDDVVQVLNAFSQHISIEPVENGYELKWSADVATAGDPVKSKRTFVSFGA